MDFSVVINDTTEIPANWTGDHHEPPRTVRTVFDILVVTSMLTMMFAMGCEVRIDEVIKHIKKPVGILVGMLGQFVFMPLMGFSAIKLLSIEGYHAISILILSCCPGGGYSNFLSYVSKGDVPLSVTLTTISNVLAFGMTPLNVWMYSHGLQFDDYIKFPFKAMMYSMAGLTAILAAGIITRWKKPMIATMLTKIGVIASALMALAGGVLALIMYSDYLSAIPVRLFAAIAIVAPGGMLLAFSTTWALKLAWPIRRTIAIESAVQNVGTAITISIISFKPDKLKDLSMYIILYGGVTITAILAAAGIYALARRYNVKSLDEDEVIVNQDTLINASQSSTSGNLTC